MQNGNDGPLVVVGGAEDKTGDCTILREFLRLGGDTKGAVVIMTVATDYPQEVGDKYTQAFKRLGVKKPVVIDVSTREDALDETAIEVVKSAAAVYFSGGDQLHVTSLLGGTPLYHALQERHAAGMVIGGTSAGAAMMSTAMILGGGQEQSPHFGSLQTGAGLNLLPGTVIDTHFAQRGRYGRLIAAVAHFPQHLGLGIDEDTALVIEAGRGTVVGAGAVTVVSGQSMTYTNVPDLQDGDAMALFDLDVHILSAGFEFDFGTLRPIPRPLKAEQGERADGRPAKAPSKEKVDRAN